MTISGDPSLNYNLRLPPLTYPGTYPFVKLEHFRDGSWSRQDETPNNETYSRGHISGAFYEHATPAGHTKHLATGMHFHYTTQGKTSTVDFSSHHKGGASHAEQFSQHHYREVASDKIHAAGDDIIHLAGGLSYHHATAGTQVTSHGHHASDHNEGSHHINIAEDQVTYIGGTKYESIGAEYGVYVPNGNFDIHVGQNFQVLSMANVTIIAQNQITLKVGTQTIVVNSQGITINTHSLNINQN